MRLLRVVLLVAALLCSGCQLRLHVDVAVDRDGGGVLAVEVAADAELLERAGQEGVDPLADLAATARGLGADGWAVQEAPGDDGGRSVRLSVPFDDAEEFNALFAELSSALAADEAVLLEPWSLSVTDETIAVEGAAAARPRRAVADYGVTPRQVVRLLDRTDAFVYDVTVALPGEVLSSTATVAEESTLRWTVAPGERVTIAAESTRPGPPWVRAVLGATAGALLAGAILWALRRRFAGGA